MRSLIMVMLSILPVLAQAEYEVATIKPNSAIDGRTFIHLLPGGGVRISGATLKFLITTAYDVRSFQLSGGDGWINTERFDVVAKADSAEAAPVWSLSKWQHSTSLDAA